MVFQWSFLITNGKSGERPLELFKLFGKIFVDNKEANDSINETVGNASDASKKFSATFKKGITVAAGIASAVGAAMVAIADSTREYRTEMGKLETAFTVAGHSSEAAAKTYGALQSVLGETDTAVEAANHIAKLVSNEQDLQTWTDICTGVFATFGDSLPIEGLTEAANETAKVGTVTGLLADALNWAGVSEDDFNAKLASCNSERERAALITDTLNGLYNSASDSYKKTNKAVLDANRAQEKWNSAMAKVGAIVEPIVSLLKGGLADAISLAADAFTRFFHSSEMAVDSLAGTSSTIEEAAAKVEELKGKILELESVDMSMWSEAQMMEYGNLKMALSQVETQYDSLIAAEQAAGTAAGDSAAQAQGATNQYVESASELADKFIETYQAIFDQVSGWFAPFEMVKTSVVTSVDEMMAAMQSQADFNATYSENLQQLGEYGLGGLADSFQALGADGAAYAQEIVTAVEKAGGAASEGGQAIIKGLADANSQVIGTQEELSQTMALLSEDIDGTMTDIVQSIDDNVADMDKGTEAYTAAVNTIEGFRRGVDAKIPSVLEKFRSLGRQITSALQSSIGTITVEFEGQEIDGSKKCGLDYVPFDGYIAELHKGEAVLTAEEAAAWRAGRSVANNDVTPSQGGGSSSVTIVQNISAVPQTPVELAGVTAAYFEQARWAL